MSIQSLDASIVVEARYFSDHNFVGRSIQGYRAGKCLLTKEAAAAVVQVQTGLKPFGLGLKMYDCYRPQSGVNDFISWSKNLTDQKMKGEFYPRVEKQDAFKLGYLSEKSGHSRGSTVDLTLIPLPAPSQPEYRPGERLVDCTGAVGRRFKDNSLDMGTGYDCFDPMAATAHPKVSVEARRNRLLLKTLMERRGFKNYDGEWWHFTLEKEPHPDTYFDVEVQ